MISAAVLFQPGWRAAITEDKQDVDPFTGEPLPAGVEEIPGRGLLQAPLWGGFSEVTASTVVDERMVLFEPPVTVRADDAFYSPTGQCWQAITEGMPRGLPGQVPEYVAVQVRHAPERDRPVS